MVVDCDVITKDNVTDDKETPNGEDMVTRLCSQGYRVYFDTKFITAQR